MIIDLLLLLKEVEKTCIFTKNGLSTSTYDVTSRNHSN